MDQLMTPMLTSTAALVMGRCQRVSRSFLIVLWATLMIICVSSLIGFTAVNVVSVIENSQVAARIRPNRHDLIVAIAAGAAGAFAYSRDDATEGNPRLSDIALKVVYSEVIPIPLTGAEDE